MICNEHRTRMLLFAQLSLLSNGSSVWKSVSFVIVKSMRLQTSLGHLWVIKKNTSDQVINKCLNIISLSL